MATHFTSLLALLPLLLLAGPSAGFHHYLEHYVDADVDVDLLCDNYELELNTERQLAEFEPYHECPLEVRSALVKLSELVGDHDDVCSLAKAAAIRAFHRQYISRAKYDEDDRQHPRVRIPLRWRRLFFAYSMRLSELCRRLTIDLLAGHGDGSDPGSSSGSDDATPTASMEARDWQLLDRWANSSSPIAQVLGEPRAGHYAGLQVPKMLVKTLKLQTKTYVEATGGAELIYQVQLTCRRRFRPVYEQTPLLFLIELAKLGFNYKGDLDADFKGGDQHDNDYLGQQQVGAEMYKWYRIALICESLGNLVLVRSDNRDATAAAAAKAEHSSASSKKRTLLKVVQDEEARHKLARGELHLLSGRELEFVAMIATAGNSSRRLDKVDLNDFQSIDSPIVDPDDKRLARALLNYHEPSLAIPLRVLLKQFHKGMFARLKGGATRVHKLVKSKLASCLNCLPSEAAASEKDNELDLNQALSNSIRDLARQLGGLKSPFWRNHGDGDSGGLISSMDKEMSLQSMTAKLWFALFLETLIVLVILALLA